MKTYGLYCLETPTLDKYRVEFDGEFLGFIQKSPSGSWRFNCLGFGDSICWDYAINKEIACRNLLEQRLTYKEYKLQYDGS